MDTSQSPFYIRFALLLTAWAPSSSSVRFHIQLAMPSRPFSNHIPCIFLRHVLGRPAANPNPGGSALNSPAQRFPCLSTALQSTHWQLGLACSERTEYSKPPTNEALGDRSVSYSRANSAPVYLCSLPRYTFRALLRSSLAAVPLC